MAGFLGRFKNLFSESSTSNTRESMEDCGFLGVDARALVKLDKQFVVFLLGGDPDVEKTAEVAIPAAQLEKAKKIRVLLNRSVRDQPLTKIAPRMPSVMPKLMRSLRDKNASTEDIVKIIIQDPLLLSTVLRQVNSAYFNPRKRRVSDIRKAVVHLGMDGLRLVMTAALLQPVIQRQTSFFGEAGKHLWLHSHQVAALAEMLARSRKLDGLDAYLVGLMHEMGRLTLLHEMCRIMSTAGIKVPPPPEALVGMLSENSALLSYRVAQEWELPNTICVALQEQTSMPTEPPPPGIGRLVAEVNVLAEYYCLRNHLNSANREVKRVAEQLMITPDKLETLEHLDT
ncbi:HDOD domain-containing protein [Marinibactrum halimedae]|nr:HDOD domain-containing protein [Marinibactrum halimedae]MCD9460488.1 HDOD domain-containing protein [Marinibactrum halimedae]